MRILGAASAAATSFPALAAMQQAGTQSSGQAGTKAACAGCSFRPTQLIISANENPLGPAQSALTAIGSTATQGGRYHFDEYVKTITVFNEQFGLKKDYSALYPGSSGPLDLALMSNIGPDKPLVYGDPSYEQGPRAADSDEGSEVSCSADRDLRARREGDAEGASIAGRILHREPEQSDRHDDAEGRHRVAGEQQAEGFGRDYRRGLPSLLQRRVLHRPGRAGQGRNRDADVLEDLRHGGHARRLCNRETGPDRAVRRCRGPSRSLASISITSAAGARASLQDKDLVPLRKKINSDIRSETLEFLAKHGYKFVPGSQGNMFMVDVKRPGKEFQMAMLKENVAIGRTWSAMPNYVRVTVGTKSEMEKFQTAFVKCMDMPPGAANGAAALHMPEFHVPSELYRG